MASVASAARTIPASPLNRDNFTAVAARNDQPAPMRSGALPTPPNSISPALPPHGLKAQLHKAKLQAVDSDLELDTPTTRKGRSPSPHALGSSGEITYSMLAKHHLPEILVNHGPLAIRHIMGYLTTSVPGFSGIPPNKARRLVTSALESRASEGSAKGGEVEFEKVGWGRWDARRRGGQNARETRTPSRSVSPGIPISRGAGRNIDRLKINMARSGSSFHFSHDDRHMNSMMEDEADKMSMDDCESASCSEAPDDDMDMNDDPEDATDDEDWAAMGAAALRAESYPNVAATSAAAAGIRSFSTSSGMARAPQESRLLSHLTADAQERDAVEALLSLGSL